MNANPGNAVPQRQLHQQEPVSAVVTGDIRAHPLRMLAVTVGFARLYRVRRVPETRSHAHRPPVLGADGLKHAHEFVLHLVSTGVPTVELGG